MNDELGRKIMTEFAELRPKTCYLTNDNDEKTKMQKAQKDLAHKNDKLNLRITNLVQIQLKSIPTREK